MPYLGWDTRYKHFRTGIESGFLPRRGMRAGWNTIFLLSFIDSLWISAPNADDFGEPTIHQEVCHLISRGRLIIFVMPLKLLFARPKCVPRCDNTHHNHDDNPNHNHDGKGLIRQCQSDRDPTERKIASDITLQNGETIPNRWVPIKSTAVGRRG
jgi:hypothetical protein